MNRQDQINKIKNDWKENNRWNGIERPYTAEEVVKLRGSMYIEYTIAKKGSEKLWNLINSGRPITALGALTGFIAGTLLKVIVCICITFYYFQTLLTLL